jgi:Kef-type K+ transport system membrane component KefB
MTDVGASPRAPFARTILSVSVVQDVVAVVLVTLLLALAPFLATAGAATPGMAAGVALQLVGSVAAGVVLGAAIAQYTTVVRSPRYLVLVLVAVAFVVVQAVRLIGFEAVLIGLAAGCTLENAFPVEAERIKSELKRCALPVYVVFFALLGTGLQLGSLANMWPWALLLATLRVTGVRAGLRWAGRHAAVSPTLVRYGWLGLVSQGGLAVTLAALLRRAFPEWNVSLESLLIAMIGVQQAVGPVCLQWVLRITGEVSEDVHGAERPAVVVSGSGGM